MHSFELKINERLEIIVDNRVYKSLVMDMNNECIKINLPVCEGQYLMLQIGDLIEINIYLENGKCFNFNAKVMSKEKEENISYYKLSKPFNIKKIQRRNFFRVGVLNNVYYKNITNIKEDEYDNIPYKEALILDLSGGGAKLKLHEIMQMHNIIFLKIKVKGIEIKLKGEVVRVETNMDKQRLYGIKFLDITQSQVDKIVEELFEITRKQRALK